MRKKHLLSVTQTANRTAPGSLAAYCLAYVYFPNRNPAPEEVASCDPFLRRQIELVNPKLVVVMGRFASQSLLGTDASIASLRGKVHRIEVAGRSVAVVVTYHPAYLLRNMADKAKSWADLCFARDVVERVG